MVDTRPTLKSTNRYQRHPKRRSYGLNLWYGAIRTIYTTQDPRTTNKLNQSEPKTGDMKSIHTQALLWVQNTNLPLGGEVQLWILWKGLKTNSKLHLVSVFRILKPYLG